MEKTNKIDKLTSACIIADTVITILNIFEAIKAYQNNHMMFCILHLIFAILFIHVIYKIVINNMA